MRLLPLLSLFLLCTSVRAQDDRARTLLAEVVAAVGGTEALYQLRDVEYTYHYGPSASLERYIFDGELSYGRSETAEGTREQFFDGQEASVQLDGQPVTDAKQLASALFSRKTNLYWLLMMQKMADPGVLATYGGTRNVEGIPYELVDVTFEDGVGVAKDRYLLYVNPYTKLVDQFLFTVAAVGRQDPILMKYTYGTFEDGVKFPVVSQSNGSANWEGEVSDPEKWSARWREGFSFNNGFTAETIRR